MPSLFQKYSQGATSLFQKYSQPIEEKRIEVSALPPIGAPEYEPAVVATTAQQIALPEPPKPVPPPEPRPAPEIRGLGALEAFRGGLRIIGQDTPIDRFSEKVTKFVEGDPESDLEPGVYAPGGPVTAQARKIIRTISALPWTFTVGFLNDLIKDPVSTGLGIGEAVNKAYNNFAVMISPDATDEQRDASEEDLLRDPTQFALAALITHGAAKPLAARNIARRAARETLAEAPRIAEKPPVRPVAAVKPSIRKPPPPPVPAEKSTAAPVVEHTKPVSAARSAAVRKVQADYIVLDPKHLSDLPALDAIQGVNMARDYPQALDGIRVGHKGRSPVGSRDILDRRRGEHQNYDLMPLEELPARFQELYGKESVADPNGVYVDMGKLLEIAENEAQVYMFESPEAAIARATGFETLPEIQYQKIDVSALPPLPEPVSLMEFRAFVGVPDPRMLMNAVRDISRLTSELIEGVKMQPKIRRGFEAGIEAMKEHDRMIRGSESTSNYLEMVIDKNVPKDRQLAMVHAYENKMKGAHWESLNSLEQSLTKDFLAKEKSKLNKFIDDNKILERMEEKEVNHIFHHWINPETGKPYQAMYGKFSKGLPQAKQRTIPTYEVGIEQGMTPATTNLGKLIGLEWQSATRSHQSRQMFASLNSIEAGIEGGIILRIGAKPKPLRMIERWDLLRDQGLTEGYERYQSPLLDKPIAYKDAQGKAVVIKPGAIGIRKELYHHNRMG